MCSMYKTETRCCAYNYLGKLEVFDLNLVFTKQQSQKSYRYSVVCMEPFSSVSSEDILNLLPFQTTNSNLRKV